WALAQVGAEMEVYPNGDMLSPATGVSQPVRVPLGIHQVTGQRYPFVDGDGRACHQIAPEAATVWLIAQKPNTTAQLQGALLMLPAVDGPVSQSVSPASPQSFDVLTGGKKGGASWGIIAWVNAQPLVQLVAATRSDVALRRAGRGYIGWCPFHDDAAPQAD